ncbi:hypothetical protein 189ceduo_00019 [Lactococcus phage STA189]|nr:hypothetical protein 189ceduo_00019 [Lactococcus phage STA189]WLW38986.1 hypothetical protein 254ceduo_00018 [Lactococcus phage STA254]
MTIKDDLKAINKDISKAKNFKWQVKRAEYWISKLNNIYPDYIFEAVLTEDEENVEIIYVLKVVY